MAQLVAKKTQFVSHLPIAPPRRLATRREKIVAALRHGMQVKGYAETTLTDLANGAGMSVSHLLYYYPSRDAVLEELCEQFVKRSYSLVARDKNKPPAERIRILADNLFHRGAISCPQFSILRELNALSAHRPKIRNWLRLFNEWMMQYLVSLFAETPRQPGLTAHKAAEIAAALWTGLVNNVDFDKTLSDRLARDLFSQTFFSLANLPQSRPAD